jgi:secreted trypsin-like serine protease
MPDDPTTYDDEVANAADGFARAAAGDDPATRLRVFTAAYTAARRLTTAEENGHGAARAASAAAPSVYDDAAFLDNDALVVESNIRIVGGVATRDFPDCVAVGARNYFCCTGTLISPGAVLTAGHCNFNQREPENPCSQRVYFGNDVREPGRIVDVRQAVSHPDYVPFDDSQPHNDLTVLLLAEEVTDVQPRPIAPAQDLQAVQTTRLVGFGNTDVASSGGYGTKRMVDVGLVGDPTAFGALEGKEFAAGAPYLNRDSCNGDSGGPAYIDVNGAWLLAGATSRGTAPVAPGRFCGDGGVYTLVDAYRDWIEEVVGSPLG